MKQTLLALAALAALIPVLAACDDTVGNSLGTQPTSSGAITLENPTTTASGLKFTDQKVGDGASAETATSVTVHYTGKLASNGKVFDSSRTRGVPATFATNGVIPGFAEAIKTMKVGGQRTALLPARLAYGANPPPGSGIPISADLIFEIELIAVK